MSHGAGGGRNAGPTFIFTFLPELMWNQLDNVVYEEKPPPW